MSANPVFTPVTKPAPLEEVDAGEVDHRVELWPLSPLLPYPKHRDLEIPELDTDARAALRADVDAHGLEHPIDIWVHDDGARAFVLAGHERYLAARSLGWNEIPCRLRDDLDTEQKRDAFVLRDNVVRRQLSVSQRAGLALKIQDILNGSNGDELPPESIDQALPNLALRGGLRVCSSRSRPVAPPNCKRENAARIAGVSHGAMSQRSRLRAATEQTPEFEAVERAADRGEISLFAAFKVAALSNGQRIEVAKVLRDTQPHERKVRLRELLREIERQSDGLSPRPTTGPGEITHPTHWKALEAALHALERRLLKDDCAHGRTIEWVLGVIRRAAADQRGADLRTLERLFRHALTRMRPMTLP